MKTLLRRYQSWKIRKYKENGMYWLERRQKTFEHLWLSFFKMERNKKSLNWLERNHNRIMNVKPPWK